MKKITTLCFMLFLTVSTSLYAQKSLKKDFNVKVAGKERVFTVSLEIVEKLSYDKTFHLKHQEIDSIYRIVDTTEDSLFINIYVNSNGGSFNKFKNNIDKAVKLVEKNKFDFIFEKIIFGQRSFCLELNNMNQVYSDDYSYIFIETNDYKDLIKLMETTKKIVADKSLKPISKTVNKILHDKTTESKKVLY